MKFSHLIEINDPLNPLIEPLTRVQLWNGLVLRAEAPMMFVPWLDACELGERTAFALPRALRYDKLIVRDVVTFEPMERICYDVPAQDDIPASSLTMTIEVPQEELLFVRFEYDDHNVALQSSEEVYYDEFRKSAYLESDIDTIRLIRQLALEGRLDSPAV